MNSANYKTVNSISNNKVNNSGKSGSKIIHNINNSNKETEFYSKYTGKDNFLDYTFLSHRSQISSEKIKDTTKSKDYIFDLINTWEINIDLMETLSKDKFQNSGTYKELSQIIKRIKEQFQNKKSLNNKITEVKGRILIEKQIMEEIKRKNEENEEYYKDQMKEYEENRENKEEYIKILTIDEINDLPGGFRIEDYEYNSLNEETQK